MIQQPNNLNFLNHLRKNSFTVAFLRKFCKVLVIILYKCNEDEKAQVVNEERLNINGEQHEYYFFPFITNASFLLIASCNKRLLINYQFLFCLPVAFNLAC